MLLVHDYVHYVLRIKGNKTKAPWSPSVSVCHHLRIRDRTKLSEVGSEVRIGRTVGNSSNEDLLCSQWWWGSARVILVAKA